MHDHITRSRAAAATVALGLLATSCTGGINAGEEGGMAFIVFTGMLLAVVVILWLVLGRED